HIVPSKITSEEIKTGEVTSLEGQPIAIQTDGAVGSVMVNEAQVIQPDIQASNGVIHAIDKVLLPPDVMARISALPEVTPGTAPAVTPGTTP
ncbi:MAG: fasciclin domain-containing protein, partial [Leptolyngbyaceae bacterium]|nr:fasciclin domain-containing protein [Leptolyngbyaceae bacterium]